MSETITQISPPSFQFSPLLGRSVYIKVECVKTSTRIDGYSNREMIYNRISYADALDGEWTALYSIPFGLAAAHD